MKNKYFDSTKTGAPNQLDLVSYAVENANPFKLDGDSFAKHNERQDKINAFYKMFTDIGVDNECLSVITL